MQFPEHKLIPRPAFWARAAEEKKNHPSYPLEMLIFVAVFYLASVIQGVIYSIPEALWLYHNKMGEIQAMAESYLATGQMDLDAVMALTNSLPGWMVAVMLLSFAALILVAIGYCRLVEKRSLHSMGLVKKGWLWEYLAGLGLGFLLFSAVYWLGAALGGWKLETAQLSGAGFGLLALLFAGYLVQGAAEELMVRGYLAGTLASSTPAPFAMLLSSVIFGLLHTGNNGFNSVAFLNIVLVGIFFCLYMIKRGSIWGACAMHSMWNYAQGCIYGLSVSGMQKTDTLYTSAITGYNDLLTGGEFGPEASLCTTVVLLVAIGVVLALKGKDTVPDLKFRRPGVSGGEDDADGDAGDGPKDL